MVDQVRGLLDRSRRCDHFAVPAVCGTESAAVEPLTSVSSPLMFLVSTDASGNRTGVLAAQSFSAPSGHLGDSATILHAGTLPVAKQPAGKSAACSPPTANVDLPVELIQRMDHELSSRGVKFVQWATDPIDDSTASIAALCRRLGMHPLASLEYLCGRMDTLSKPPSSMAAEPSAKLLSLVPLDWDDATDLRNFETLVERTYQDTTDCPELCKFRNAAQTLRGYREVDSFDADRWYWTVRQHENEAATRVGCVIMASHRSPKSHAAETYVPTSELVYMALVPEYRGNGWGPSLLGLALSEPANRFASAIVDPDSPPQIVLAVDQQNGVARKLYKNAGFKRLLGETVWGRSVGDTFSTTT